MKLESCVTSGPHVILKHYKWETTNLGPKRLIVLQTNFFVHYCDCSISLALLNCSSHHSTHAITYLKTDTSKKEACPAFIDQPY